MHTALKGAQPLAPERLSGSRKKKTTMLGKTDIPARDRYVYSWLYMLAHMVGQERAERYAGGIRRRLEQRIEKHLSRSSGGGLVEVERRTDLGPREFLRDYVARFRPVLFEGAARGWESVKQWTPAYIAERYGDDPVQLISASTDDVHRIMNAHEEESEHVAGVVKLRDVVNSMGNGSRLYARFSTLLHDHPELVEQFDVAWLNRLMGRLDFERIYQLFLGPQGSVTHNHCALGANLFVQVYGKKRWYVTPTSYNAILRPPLLRAPYFFSELDPENPDYERFPLQRYVRTYVVEAGPGDVLYIPPLFWHHVRNLTDSIGVGFRWYNPIRIFQSSTLLTLLTLFSTNPRFLQARKSHQDFTKIFAAGRTAELRKS